MVKNDFFEKYTGENQWKIMMIQFIFIFDALYVTFNLILFSQISIKESIMVSLLSTLLLFMCNIFICIMFQVNILYYMMEENDYEHVKNRLVQFDYYIIVMFFVHFLLCFFLKSPFDIFLYNSMVFQLLLILINGYIHYENEIENNSNVITVQMV